MTGMVLKYRRKNAAFYLICRFGKISSLNFANALYYQIKQYIMRGKIRPLTMSRAILLPWGCKTRFTPNNLGKNFRVVPLILFMVYCIIY
jgi:hypothetical protein